MTFIAGFLTGITSMVGLGLLIAWLWWAAGDPEVENDRSPSNAGTLIGWSPNFSSHKLYLIDRELK